MYSDNDIVYNLSLGDIIVHKTLNIAGAVEIIEQLPSKRYVIRSFKNNRIYEIPFDEIGNNWYLVT